MPNKLMLKGFDELRADLARLPADLQADATPILSAHARSAEAQLLASYPVVTGALHAGVQIIERVAHGVAVLLTLQSGAPHAHLYEFGTSDTRPHAVFLPITERERRWATTEVATAVEKHGLKVRGARD